MIKNKVNNKELIIAVLLILSIVSLVVIRDRSRLDKVKGDFTNLTFLSFLFIIIGISVWGFTTGSKKIQNATRHAIVGFLIAYFAHIDMVFVAFFLVGTFVYFTDNSIS